MARTDPFEVASERIQRVPGPQRPFAVAYSKNLSKSLSKMMAIPTLSLSRAKLSIAA